MALLVHYCVPICTKETCASAVIGPDGGDLVLGDAELHIPAGVLALPTEFEIRRVAHSRLPDLPPGLINVTSNVGGYQFLPAGTKFPAPVDVILPVDPDPWYRAISQSLNAKTYYWDQDGSRWHPLAEARLDPEQNRIHGKTTHFTFMVNGVIKAPDQTAPTAFDANSIKDIGIASPLANVDLIEPPQATNKGDAQLSFPIRLPVGRGAHSPTLQLTYSSSGGNGPLGVGWQLPVSVIEIDTRWGVPRFDGKERFLLDGKAIVPVSTDDIPTHGIACVTGNSIGMFATRIQGFNRIYRCDDDADSEPPHWEVTSKDGTRFEYGTSTDSRLGSYRVGESDRISRWSLSSVVDVNGNVTDYQYLIDTEQSITDYLGEPFRAQYLRSIVYTRFDRTLSRRFSSGLSPEELAEFTPVSLDSKYRVDLTWLCANGGTEDRTDTPSNGRAGFLVVTRCRLGQVAVRHGDSLQQLDDNTKCTDASGPPWVRCYSLAYEQSYDFKSLLSRVSAYGREGTEFYAHEFDYTQPEFREAPREKGYIGPFAPPESWEVNYAAPNRLPLDDTDHLVDLVEEDTHSATVGVGVSVRFGSGSGIGCSVGDSIGGSIQDPNPRTQLLDINSDGIADRVFMRGNVVIAALGNPPSDESGCFGKQCGNEDPNETPEELLEGNQTLGQVGDEIGFQGTLSRSASCNAGVTLSGNLSLAHQVAIGQTRLIDADGDGYADLVGSNRFYRRLPRECRDGKPATGDTCSDGLKICTEPNALCFVEDQLSAAAHSNASSPPVRVAESTHADQENTPGLSPFQVLPTANAQNISADSDCGDASDGLRSCINEVDTVSTAWLHDQPEDGWGPNTSIEKRVRVDPVLAERVADLSPVIRWDAPHDGEIRLTTSVCAIRPEAIGMSLDIYSQSKADPSDTTRIGGATVTGTVSGESCAAFPPLPIPGGPSTAPIPVSFGDSILFVIRSPNPGAVTWAGQPMDEASLQIDIKYLCVTRFNDGSCRALSLNDVQTNIGPTGHLEYWYNYPRDFRVSELPHQRYWQLLPPIDAAATRSSKTTDPLSPIQRKPNSPSIPSLMPPKPSPRPNPSPIVQQFDGVLVKTKTTDSDVVARLRCESASAYRRKSDIVCRPGTVLNSWRLSADETGTVFTRAQLPDTFISVKKDTPDLTIESMTTDGNQHAGGRLNHRIVIKNIGRGISPPTTLQLRLGGESPNNAHVFQIPILFAKQTYLIETQNAFPAGRFRATATIDPNDEIDEDDETNNQRLTNFDIATGSPPNLADLSVAMIHTETNWDQKTASVSFRLFNAGSKNAPESKVRIALAGTIHELLVPPVPAGTSTERLQLTLPLESEGRRRLVIRVDIDNDVEEIFEERRFARTVSLVNPLSQGLKVFDPIRVLLEIDGVNGAEIPPDAVSWNAAISIFPMDNITKSVIADGSEVLVAGGTDPLSDLEDPLLISPPVLYRVHPNRKLESFSTSGINQRVYLTATISRQKSLPDTEPLHVSVHRDGANSAVMSDVIELPGSNGPKAVTRRWQATLPSDGVYSVRGYKEAEFEPALSFRLMAETWKETPYYTVVRSPLGPYSNYGQLNSNSKRIAVLQNSERASLARSVFPNATIVEIPRTLGYEETLASGAVFKVASNGPDVVGTLTKAGITSEFPLERAPLYYFREYSAHAALIERHEFPANWNAQTPAIFPLFGGTVCCVRNVPPILPFAYPIYVFGEVPTNLITADYGRGIQNPFLVGEVPHSLDAWSGGHHGFFYGLFNTDAEPECIGPVPCAQVIHQLAKVSPVQPLGDATAVAALMATSFSFATATRLSNPDGPYAPGGEPTPGPVPPDDDDDGIVNSADASNLPEDFDGYRDTDGSPERCDGNDLDGDGINNCEDAAPNSPANASDIATFECDGDDSEQCLEDLDNRFAGLSPASDSQCMSQTGVGPEGGGGYICGGGSRIRGGTSDGVAAGSSDSLGIEVSQTQSLNAGYSSGVDIAGYIGGSRSEDLGLATTYTSRSINDWNGDSVLDMNYADAIELGGRDETVRFNAGCHISLFDDCLIHPGIREATNTTYAQSFSIQGRFADMAMRVLGIEPQGPLIAAALSSQSYGVSVQGANSKTVRNRIDINGDGLPDLLNVTDTDSDPDTSLTRLWGRLNFGYELGAFSDFGEVAVYSGAGQGLNAAINAESDNDPHGRNRWLIEKLGSLADSNNITVAETAGASLGASAGIVGGGGSFSYSNTASSNQTERLLVDMNGDGLIDVVSKAAGHDRINVGLNTSGFLPYGSTVFADYSPGRNGLTAELWPNGAKPRFLKQGIFDNGQVKWVLDHLPFKETPIMDASDSFDVISETATKAESWAGSANVTIFFVNVSGSYSYTRSYRTQQLTLADMDGDGLADRVLRSGNENRAAIQVQRNLMGGGNLLKTVHRPFGGRIDLNYERTRSSEADPNSRWVLKESTLGNDEDYPYESDQLFSAPLATTYQYRSPYYDRYEKEFYGFRTVTEERGDGRYTVIDYYNRDYWKQGLVDRTSVYADADAETDANQGPLVETVSTYDPIWQNASNSPVRQTCIARLILPLRRLNSSGPSGGKTTPCDVWFPRQTEFLTYYREGNPRSDPAAVFKQRYTEYDGFGNVTELVEEHAAEDGLDESDVLVASIEYETGDLLESHIFNRPKSIELRQGSHDGPLIRKRASRYDKAGNMTRHETWSDIGDPADPDDDKLGFFVLDYDSTAFAKWIEDSNGFRVNYTPDDILHQFPKEIFLEENDEWSRLSSTVAYDYAFQTPISTTDTNDQTIERNYDEFARLTTLWGPYEHNTSTPTVDIGYASTDIDFPAYAITTNAASKNPGSSSSDHSVIRTVQFTDGLGRDIQTQSDADDFGQHVRRISGKLEFDLGGRTTEQGEPSFLPLGSSTSMPFPYEDIGGLDGPITETAFDSLDRITRQALPGERVSQWAYRLVEDPDDSNLRLREVQVTDPNQEVEFRHYDSVDRVVTVTQKLSDTQPTGCSLLPDCEDITTKYGYSPVGDLLTITSNDDRVRHYTYDLAGRQKSIVTDDTGRFEYQYDAMGNLVAWTDQVLCDVATTPLLPTCNDDQKVKQGYDYSRNRLLSIDYPETTDVHYHYGDRKGDIGCDGLTNTNGRICRIEDGGGIELRSRGALGELVQSTRISTIGTFANTERQFTTRKKYDSFGRLLSVQYPDGEEVTYDYDAGGQVSGVIGDQPYVKSIQYDIYGKPLETVYGNDVVVVNQYEGNRPGDAFTQRLQAQVICPPGASSCSLTTSSAIKRISYSYDRVGNILRIDEQRGADESIFSSIDRRYCYDSLHRLKGFSSTHSRVPGAPPGVDGAAGRYMYDNVNNLTAQEIALSEGTPPPDVQQDFCSTFFSPTDSLLRDGATPIQEYPTKDWTYTNFTRPSLPDTIGPYSLAYDSRGTVTDVTLAMDGDGPNGTTFTWDDSGRLKRSTPQGQPISNGTDYYYGASNQRIRKEAPAVVEPFAKLYPSEYYGAQIRRIDPVGCTTDSTVSCDVDTEFRTKSIRLNGQQVASVNLIVDPSSMSESEDALLFLDDGQTIFLHADQVNSTSLATNTYGESVNHYEYLPFGEIVPQASIGSSNDVGFSAFNGKELDPETGMQYFGARYYDPKFGKWSSADPLFVQKPQMCLSSPNECNLYAFARGNPISYGDPSGGLAVNPQIAYIQAYSRARNSGVPHADAHQIATEHREAHSGMHAVVGKFIWDAFADTAGDLVELGTSIYNQDATGVAFAGGALFVPGVSARGARQITDAASDFAKKRADEIHSALGKVTQDKTTTAVTETAEGIRVVSSSERRLRPAQRRMLQKGEIEGIGPGHAEVTGIEAARSAGLTPTGTAASRPICSQCAETLAEEGVAPLSPLKE